MPGLFVVFEGPDAGGTTTQSALLAQRLEASGLNVLLTREPTEGATGQHIRRILRGEEDAISPEELQKLFCDDRAEHVEQVILPALREDTVVICDRYIVSTLVYGEVAGVDAGLLAKWNEDFLEPHLLFFTLPPFDVCMERIRKRGVTDSFETEEFQRRVHMLYRSYVKQNFNVTVLDTSKPKEETTEEVYRLVHQLL